MVDCERIQMANLSVFDTVASSSLSPYKDQGHKELTNKTKHMMSQYKIMVIPSYMYKHLNKVGSFNSTNLQEHLSYEDMASLIVINNLISLSGITSSSLHNSLVDPYKTNVEFLLKTDNLTKSVKTYLNIIESVKAKYYEITNIENTILVVIEGGFSNMLLNKEFKKQFLKDLCSICYNVMGDGNTSAQPFFKEFVDIL